MFNLETAITAWRKHMLATGIQSPVPLEELEIHLRDEIDRQVESGTSPQEAFENSVRQMGHAEELKGEFKKICGGGVNRYPRLTIWIRRMSQLKMTQWSLLRWGVSGLVLAQILTRVGPLLDHSYPVWTIWLPYCVTFTTFAISGLVIGFARWHTRWTLLWVTSIGLIGTMMVSSVCRSVFHGSDFISVFLHQVHLSWWAFYANWMFFIVLGLVAGLSNRTLWLRKYKLKTISD